MRLKLCLKSPSSAFKKVAIYVAMSPIKPMRTYKLISLFSGAGGMDLGFEKTGRWRTVLATDIHPKMCETLRRNKGQQLTESHTFLDGAEIIEGDIQEIDVPSKVSGCGIDLVIGGPPCQSFSAIGKQDGYDSERGNLIYEFAHIVKELQPKFFLFENVPNMKAGKWAKMFGEFLEFLAFDGNYRVRDYLLCCADFGAATIRRRIFIVGTHRDLKVDVSFPPPTHSRADSGDLFDNLAPYVTVAQVFNGLPAPSYKFSYPDLHFAPCHDEETIKRFVKLKYGETDPKRKRDRLHPDEPSLTLMSGGEAGGTRLHIHPFEPREITLREAARIHGFPDDYVFAGNKSQISIQISNSVPVPIAEAWGRHLAQYLDAAP